MSNDTLKEEKKTVGNLSNTHKIIIGALVACVIALAIGLGVAVSNNNKDTGDLPIDQALGLDGVGATLVDDKEKEKLVTTVGKALEDARTKNLMLNVQDGEASYVTLVYNKSGEALAQASETGYITVYRKDGKAVRYTDYVDFGYDSDVLSLIENVHEMARDGKAEILGAAEEDQSEGFTQMIVDVRAWDNIEKLYNMFDPTFGKIMVEQLKTSLVEASASEENSLTEDTELNFRFIYAVDSKTGILDSAACYLYFGDTPSNEVKWIDISASWAFGGIRDVYDWELDEEWYTIEWDKIAEWEDTVVAEDLLNKQYNSLMEMLNTYAVDNGEEPVVMDSEEVTEDVEDVTKDAEDVTSSGSSEDITSSEDVTESSSEVTDDGSTSDNSSSN